MRSARGFLPVSLSLLAATTASDCIPECLTAECAEALFSGTFLILTVLKMFLPRTRINWWKLLNKLEQMLIWALAGRESVQAARVKAARLKFVWDYTKQRCQL